MFACYKLAIMWNKIKNSDYFIEFSPSLELLVTNFVSVWHKQFTNSSFLASLKSSNPRMEIDEKELLEKGTRMIENPSDWKKREVKEEGDDSLILCVSVMYGCPIHFSITLAAGSKELFFVKVTQRLILTINDLRASETELRIKLQKKDKEIEEYKCEGGEIALRHLKTTQYLDDVHMQSHCNYDNLFGPAINLNDIQLVKSIAKPDPTATVKLEPKKVKDEPAAVVSTASNHAATTIKQEEIVKNEPPSEPQSCVVSSPRKKQKRKLNI